MKIFLLLIIFAISGSVYSQSLLPNQLTSPKKNYLEQLDNQVFVTYNYIHNLGKFGDDYDYGSGATLNYGKYFANSWLVIARVGYIKQNLRSGVDSGAYKDFNVYPIHVGGRFYLYKKIFMPYFSFMNGINLIGASDFLGNGEVSDQKFIRYAFQVGFGFDVKFAKNFGVNLNINYNNSFYEDYDVYDEQNSKMLTGFEYVGGLFYSFGK
ncbi:MAG TPA: hypothetical protein PKD83_09935 [Ignavibacteria bacterium]|nr:hypothetical protein [Ignavibacteria bacterium]